MHGRRSEGPKEGADGWTLIELMVVLVVAAILATIAYPSYQDSVRKARRAEVRAVLLQIMQQQERYYSQRNTYVAFSSSSSDEDAKRFKWFSGADAKSSAYEISGEACSSSSSLQDCVLLKAVPGSGNVDIGYKDVLCGTLTLSSTGERGAADPLCWK